ncbi:MAG: hypothetical protein SFW07_02935 [Gammaproteobacteria bacterium]|nr:hypothetical protein [Gammaproteobacteria bacterium]
MSSDQAPKKIAGNLARENHPQQCFFAGERVSRLQALLDMESKLAQQVYAAADALKATENKPK